MLKIVYISLFVILSFVHSRVTLANDSIQISNIKIIQEYFSKVTLRVTANYDGKFGTSSFFGVTAITNENARGSGFSPFVINEGISEIDISVTRPFVDSLKGFTSQSLQFTVYNESQSLQKTINFEYKWRSFEDYFDSNVTGVGSQSLASIRSLRIDESINTSKGFVRGLVSAGISPDKLKLIYVEKYGVGTTVPGFVFSETISVSDFKSVVEIAQKNNISVENIAFKNLEHSDFKIGHIDILPARNIPIAKVTSGDVSEVFESNSFDKLFGKLRFKATPKEELNLRLLEKAIALNNQGGREKGEQAQEITEYLIDVGYQNSRIYAELARAYGRVYNYNHLAIQKRRSILNLALSLYPNDQWAHALLIFDETNLGNYEAAQNHAVLATKHEKVKNIWTIVNWARLYEVQGKTVEAKEKYKELFGQPKLDKSNQRAHKRGLAYYSALLEKENSSEVKAVYQELLSTYPIEEKCTATKLAKRILVDSDDYTEAKSLLERSTLYSCENIDSAVALLSIRDWYKFGGKTPVQSLIVKHGDLTELVYELASMKNGVKIINLIKSNSVNITASNQNGLNALHLSIASKNTVAASNLLQANFDINSTLPNGWTPLMIAVYMNSPELVELLLNKGADKSAKTAEGYSALSIAEQGSLLDIVELLENNNL